MQPVKRLSLISRLSEEIRQVPEQHLLRVDYVLNIIPLNPLKFSRCHPYFIVEETGFEMSKILSKVKPHS